ncbi:Arginine N-methyltransferase [Hirschfeldia incana]|nr:Arginine N-methyltransferase [Hirschfeldia incana]
MSTPLFIIIWSSLPTLFSLSLYLSLQSRVCSLKLTEFTLMESLMMEEKKQLDFNRPLISVRRPIQTPEPNSKTSSSNSVTNKIPRSPPVYKSDINSGPIRNPGTVPFQWEHKPGKPKDERKPELQSVVQQHFVPKLPPGRIVKSREREELVRKPEPRVDHVEDARSCSSSCNVSGVSGLDGQRMLVEPFGTLSSDRQTQDLMMGRFLPAAKALTTSETPPHLARKPPKPEEPARQIVVVKEKQNKAEQNPYRFHHSPDYQEEEDGDMSSMMASGVCGLLPQICLRSSFGVLNPVPSVRMKAQRGVSVRRMRSKYQDSCNGSSQDEALSVSSTPPEGREKLENLSSGSRTKTSKKNFGELLASDDNTWKPSSHEALVVEKTLYVDTVHSVNKKVQEASNEQSILQSYPTLDVVPVKEDVEASKEEVISGLKVEDCADQAIAEVVEIAKEKIDFEVRLQQGTTKNLESSRLHHNHHIVAPPPLPKAPSDSWLKRTLPTVPSKNNAFTWLQSLGTDDNNQITKWETMVKTSNTQQGFVCFSKETLNPIPEA